MFRPPKILVCDLDNTLYDWVDYFVSSFYAMVDVVVELTGCNREILLDDFKKVHQHYHDSENPFSLLETATIARLYPNKGNSELKKLLDPAFHAFNSTRKRSLALFPGVKETLDVLDSSGIKLVAHTESNFYAVADRLRRLSLTNYFLKVYCRERPSNNHPDGEISNAWLADFPMEKIKELTRHQKKPDETILLEICSSCGIAPEHTAYVGDSMARDVLMAKKAKVFAIWAAYGARHDSSEYEKLVRITHWTSEDVEREKQIAKQAESIRPDFIAERFFSDILQPFGLSMSKHPVSY